MFMFNISPLRKQVAGFGGADGSVSMARQYAAIMRSLEPPASIFGWSVAEAEFSQYGHAQCNSVVASNLSFHAKVPPLGSLPFRQNLEPRIAKPEKKVYFAFVPNEGDTLVTLTQLFYDDCWLSPERGKVATSWAINPYFAKLFPSLVEYYFRTKTDKDYFVCGPSGAGYVHPDAMPKKDLERFIQFTGRWMNEGATLREIVLWEARDPNVIDAFARGIPNLRGVTVKPEEMYPYGEMLYTSTRGVPVLREPGPTQYWHFNKRFLNPGKPDASGKLSEPRPMDINIPAFLKFLDELDSHVEKPYCFMIYGLQDRLIPDIVRIQNAMDKNRFEIVDLGTLCHLATFERQRLKRDLANSLRTAPVGANRNSSPNVPLWKSKHLQQTAGWTPLENAVFSADKRGLRVEIARGRDWGQVVTPEILLPVGVNRIRIRVSDVQSCRWVVCLEGQFPDITGESVDIQGKRIATKAANWRPFSENSWERRHPGVEERPLEKSFIINNTQRIPLKIRLGVVGSSGGYAVFESLEFLR
jgi:hypothetical protein